MKTGIRFDASQECKEGHVGKHCNIQQQTTSLRIWYTTQIVGSRYQPYFPPLFSLVSLPIDLNKWKLNWTPSLPQTSRANPVQCCSTNKKRVYLSIHLSIRLSIYLAIYVRDRGREGEGEEQKKKEGEGDGVRECEVLYRVWRRILGQKLVASSQTTECFVWFCLEICKRDYHRL